MAFDYKKWLFKYKLLHVFLWACIGLLLFVTDFDTDYSLGLYIGQSILVPLFSCIPFYLSAYYFVPKFLYRKKYAKLIVSLLLLIIVCAFIQIPAIRFILHFFEERLTVIPDSESAIGILYTGFWNNTLCVFIGGGLKVISDRFKMEKKLLQTEKEKVSTELDFLRSQVNPHFLFNVMNTIYFQIDKKNDTARASVEKLSEMLRYQLYECNSDRIEIKRELEYIKNYVAMQTLRLEKGSDVQLNIEVENEDFRIAPLLILPIVENAFKHISHFKDPFQNKIHISLSRQNGEFIVDASNTYDKTGEVAQVIQSGGLGVQNLKRRLELLYPGRHEITVNKNENFFHTILKLQYHD